MNSHCSQSDKNGSPQKTVRLLIWWRGKLQLGSDLTPEFRIRAEHLTSTPEITFRLDERLEKNEGWKESPQVRLYSDPDHSPSKFWDFDEKLSIKPKEEPEGDAVYALTIKAVFNEPENGRLVPYRFENTIRLKVQKKGGKVEIEAGEGALVNVAGFSGISDCVIHAKDGSLVNVRPSVLCSTADSGEEKPLEIELFPTGDKNFSFSDKARDRITLRAEIQNRPPKYYRIFALSEIRVGRVLRPEGKEPNHIAYRFYESDGSPDLNTPSDFVSMRISRSSFSFWIKEDGLEVRDLGAAVKTRISLSGRSEFTAIERGGGKTFSWKESADKYEIEVAETGKLEMAVYRCCRDENSDSLQTSKYEFQRIGAQNGIKALKLKRKQDLSRKIIERLEENRKRKEWGGNLNDNCRRELQLYESDKSDSGWSKDPFFEKEEYVILLQEVTIGNDKRLSPIYIPDAGIDASHAKVVYNQDGGFELDNNHSRAIEWRSSGDSESRWFYKGNPSLQLSPGVTFDIGDVHFVVEE